MFIPKNKVSVGYLYYKLFDIRRNYDNDWIYLFAT